jgi:septum formation protein
LRASAPHLLILASASPTRAAVLQGACVPFQAIPPRIDEEAIKARLRADGTDREALAMALAEAKAASLSAPDDDRHVLGGDQVLILNGRVFDKPKDRADAAGQLRALRGRTHRLVSAAAIARGGTVVWRRAEEARLTMRDFSDRFVEDYLDAVGEAAFGGPGAYRVEGRGIQLFAAIDGLQPVILGLPLLALLDYLRQHGFIQT